MMPLNHILRKCTTGYKLSKSQENINHLMYMDGIKLFAKERKGVEKPNTDCKNIQSGYINIEFGIEKWVMKSDKRHMSEGIELLHQEQLCTLGEK